MLPRLLRNLIAVLLVLLSLPFRALRPGLAYVRFRLKGDPPYRKPARRPLFSFGRRDPAQVISLETFRRQLEVLAQDPRIRGAIIEVDGFTGSAAKRQAISELLGRLRQAGKEVVGFAVSADTTAYELLCACQRIALAPGGRLDLIGFSAEATAMASALRSVGIGAHFVRRGEHKTAPELFTHEEVSEIQRRAIETILEERHAALLEILSRGRRLSREEAAGKVDGGPYGAKSALREGLVDLLASSGELGKLLGREEDRPKEAGGPKEARIDHFQGYARSRAFPPFFWRRLRRSPRLSVVAVSGIIAHGDGGATPLGPLIAGSEAVARALRAARRERSCAVLLYVSSPGGSAVGSELMLEEVKRTAAQKPMVAFFDRVAASGGYMVALGAKEIWSAPEAIAGSIGVFAGKFDLSALLERLGIRRTVIARGENAAIYSSSRPFTEKERQALEREVEETYQAFLEHVAASRKRTKEEVHARAEGRVYSGKAALEAGLVDRLGQFEEACRRALELAGQEVEDFEVVLHGAVRRRFSLLRLLQLAQSSAIYSLVDPPLLELALGAQGMKWLGGGAPEES